jgi:hypothetical protein
MRICQRNLVDVQMRGRGDDDGWEEVPGQLKKGRCLSTRANQGEAGSIGEAYRLG